MFGQIVRQLMGKGRNALPADVQAVLDGARCYSRDGGDEGPRIMVSLAGGGLRGAWFHDRETTEARIRRRWPELTGAQVRRAVDCIEAKAMQAASLEKPQGKRRGWIHDY